MDNWTDEQDELAYDTFKNVARLHGREQARKMMNNLQNLGSPIRDVDIQAWEDRYLDELDS